MIIITFVLISNHRNQIKKVFGGKSEIQKSQ